MQAKGRVLLGNAGALFAIQIANYVLPFLLIPYLTRVLGASLYGVIAFGLAIVQLACVVTDYGFSLSGTLQVAKQQADRSLVQRTISAVMVCKLLLLLPVIALLGLFVSLQDKYAEYQLFLWLLLLPIVGQTLQPIWFFQGIERMGFITVYTVLSRTLYLGLVVWWVSLPADHHWVAVANGLASLVAAVVGLGMMWRLGYRPVWCGWRFVRQTFRASTEYFWSRAALATYTAGGAFFLGLVSTPLQVGYYSAAEQLYKGAQSLFSPLSQALFPHMARHRNFPLFFRILRAVVVLAVLGLGVGVLIGPRAIAFLFGEAFAPSYPVLVIFMITFCLSTPSVLLGYPFLGALGNSNAANMSVIFAGLLQVASLLVCLGLGLTQATHIALTVMVAETFVLLYRAGKARALYGAIRLQGGARIQGCN